MFPQDDSYIFRGMEMVKKKSKRYLIRINEPNPEHSNDSCVAFDNPRTCALQLVNANDPWGSTSSIDSRKGIRNGFASETVKTPHL